jgi:hypothetical protein
MAMKS